MIGKLEDLNNDYKDLLATGIINYLKHKGLDCFEVVEIANHINERMVEFFEHYREMQLYLERIEMKEVC